MVYKIENEKEFMEAVLKREDTALEIFHEKYDRLIWDISHKWYSSINTVSKGQYELVDIHSELWCYIYDKANKYDYKRSKISSWIYLVAESKAGMIKRSFESKKNNIYDNEKVSLNDTPCSDSYDSSKNTVEINNVISDGMSIEKTIVLQEFVLDFAYLLLELIDACTEKERKVYLLKIKGKQQVEIAREAGVSESYIPKVYKRMSKKFRSLYNTLEEQTYINKTERDIIARDLLSNSSAEEVSEKHDLEPETILICREILEIVGVHDY